MKFLCGNCKAKYQIADEKASGKTLRMKCRRCGHDILIDGHNVSPSSAPPAPRRSGSVVPSAARSGSGAHALPSRPLATQGLPPRPAALRSKPPSALGTEFRRHIAAPPEVPQRTAPYDLWHVAIKDVPVGPMTREELGRKIEAGAVTEDSLCWREGMDDWRPLGELPELSQLLRRSREGGRSRPPPRHRPPPQVPAHPPAPQGARTPSGYPAEFDELEEDYSEPTRIADVAAAAAAPAAGSHAQPGHAQPGHAGGTSPKIALPTQAQVAASMSSTLDIPAPVAPAPARQGLSGLGYLAIGLLGGILLVAGPMLYKTFWGGAQPANPTQTVAQQPVATVQPATPAQRDVQLDVPAEPEVDKQQQAAKPVKPQPGVRNTKTEVKEGPSKELSAEEQALLKRMGGGGGEINLNGQRPRDTEGAASGGGGPALTPSQLTKVVQDNKVQLQRCYETALRAAGGRQDGTIKVTVNVTVGMSGSVKSVSTDGTGIGNMTDCIKQSVKRWRFPQSGSDSPFAFPLVFQPGA